MPSILIVDDSAVDRRLVGALVSKDPDLAVEYANDGAEAIAAVSRRLPDLVITDLVMPEMNGLELVTAVRRDYPHVPVILMTSQGNEEIAVEALARGAASYVEQVDLGRQAARHGAYRAGGGQPDAEPGAARAVSRPLSADVRLGERSHAVRPVVGLSSGRGRAVPSLGRDRADRASASLCRRR